MRGKKRLKQGRAVPARRRSLAGPAGVPQRASKSTRLTKHRPVSSRWVQLDRLFHPWYTAFRVQGSIESLPAENVMDFTPPITSLPGSLQGRPVQFFPEGGKGVLPPVGGAQSSLSSSHIGPLQLPCPLSFFSEVSSRAISQQR